MGAVERVFAEHRRLLRRRSQRARLDFAAGPAVVEPFEAQGFGHDPTRWVPEEYGDYLVTSNEVWSACRLRSALAGTVRMRMYRGDTADKRELPDSAPAKLLRYVNPFWSDVRLARMDELAMCLWGATAWAVEKRNGVPYEIWWLKPSRLRPVPDSKKYIKGYIYESNVGGQDLRFEPDEIVWQRYPNPLDEFSPISPIAAARLAADTGSAAMKSNQQMHTKGLQIAGMVVPKQKDGHAVQFSPEQAKQLETDLERRFAGADKAHRWAVLRYEAEFKPVNITPKDAEFVNGMGITARMVYNAYAVPSALLNDLEHATLANLRELTTVLWEHGLCPDLGLRAADVREQFLPMFRPGKATPDHCEYDFTTVAALQKSQSETWDRERQAIEVGAMLINEWRRKQGLPPVPWGDVWWAPVNKSAVTDATSTPQGDTSPTGEPPAEQDDRFAEVLAALDWHTDLSTLNGHGGH